MPIYPKLIEKLIGESGVGFNNAKNHPVIKEQIVSHGYNDEKLDALIQLNKTADEKYHNYERLFGEQLEATNKLDDAVEVVMDNALIYRQMSLKVFDDDRYRGYRSQLGIDGAFKRNFDAIIEQTTLMYDTTIKKPEIMEFFSGYGVTAEKLQESLLKVEELKRLNETQEEAKGKAVAARKERDDAFKELKTAWELFKYTCRRIFKGSSEFLKILNIKPRSARNKKGKGDDNGGGEGEGEGGDTQTEPEPESPQELKELIPVRM